MRLNHERKIVRFHEWKIVRQQNQHQTNLCHGFLFFLMSEEHPQGEKDLLDLKKLLSKQFSLFYVQTYRKDTLYTPRLFVLRRSLNVCYHAMCNNFFLLMTTASLSLT
jgi:hypothetical protein